jgi:hypothetical protein
MDVNVPESRSVVCGSKRELLISLAEKVYQMQLCRPFTRTRNPAAERYTSGFRVRAKVRAPE